MDLKVKRSERPPCGWDGIHRRIWNLLLDANVGISDADRLMIAISPALAQAESDKTCVDGSTSGSIPKSSYIEKQMAEIRLLDLRFPDHSPIEYGFVVWRDGDPTAFSRHRTRGEAMLTALLLHVHTGEAFGVLVAHLHNRGGYEAAKGEKPAAGYSTDAPAAP